MVIVEYIGDGNALFRISTDPGPPPRMYPERLTSGGWVFYGKINRLLGFDGADGDPLTPDEAHEMAARIAPGVAI